MTNPNHTDTSRSGDLVERLREYCAYCPSTDRDDHPICDEAADRIEALEAEAERLRRDHAALAKQLDIAERKLKGVTKLWHADRAALGEK